MTPPSRCRRIVCLLSLSLLAATALSVPAAAQSGGFGENKVVLKDFEWKVVSSPHFDIHYYDGSAAWAPAAARFLEKHYQRHSRLLDHEFTERVPFFLYGSINDFQQSNIVTVGDGVGGVTEAFKDRFMVYNDGSEEWLEDVIAHELAHVFQFKILLGGFWKSIRILKLVFYPQWLMEGSAEHMTGDLNQYGEDLVVRDAALSPGGLLPISRLQNFAHLKPHQITLAYKEGAAACQFIEKEYGPQRLGEMFRLFVSRFETGAVLLDTLGLELKTFDRKFQEYVTERYSAQAKAQGLREPTVFGDPLTRPEDDLPQFNTSPVFTPDGRWLAYLSTRRGHPPEVYLQERGSRRRRRLVGKEFSAIENIPLGNFGQISRQLALSPDGRTLAFTAQKNHVDYLFLYDLPGARLERRELAGFMTLNQPAFSPDGRTLALSGMKDGFTDLIRYDLKTRQVAALTDDPADDQSPAWSPDGAWLAFSSEINAPEAADPHQRGLFLLRLSDGMRRALPRLPGRSRDPVFSPDGKRLLFVNDSTGVSEVYEAEVETGRTRRLTRTVGGNFTPSYLPDGKGIAFVSHRHGEEHVYAGERSRFLDEEAATVGPDITTKSTESTKNGEETLTSTETAKAPFVLGAERPYRFKASTDLFLPAFFFSSPGGLFWTSYWQASDLLGNHTIANYINYNSGAPFLLYSLDYSYSRYRPQIVASARGQAVHDDFDAFTNSRTDHSAHQVVAGVAYPLDRYHRVELLAGAETERIDYNDFGVTVRREYRTVKAAGVRDTATGRYLMPVEGSRLRVEVERNARVLGGDQRFDLKTVEAQKYFPLERQRTLALRLLGQESVGPDGPIFTVGGVPGGLRGFRRTSARSIGRYTAQSSAEVRFPLVRNIDYDMAFFFPDIYFKALYGVVFDDAAWAYDTRRQARTPTLADAQNSVGAGVRLHAFVLQAFPLVIALDAAKQTTGREWVVYLYIGPSF